MAKSNKLTASNATAERKVVGIPTEADKAKARAKAAAKPRGGKPGSATGAQSAQYAEGELSGTPAATLAKAVAAQKDAGGMAGKSAVKITRAKARQTQSATGGLTKPVTPKTVNADRIAECKNATSGDYVVATAGGKSLPIARSKFTGELAKLAIVGGSMKAVEAYIKEHAPQAQLARGLSGKDAPQSAMAAAESRKPAKAPEAPAKTGKTAKVAAQKEAKTAKASGGKLDMDAKLAEVAPNPKKAGTSTHARYAAAYKVGRTVAEMLKHTTRADIDWDLKRGFIKLA